MCRKLNAKQMTEREEFEQVNDLFAMLAELSDKLKCTSIFNGMTAASQAQFLNYCKENNDVYIFYAYLS